MNYSIFIILFCLNIIISSGFYEENDFEFVRIELSKSEIGNFIEVLKMPFLVDNLENIYDPKMKNWAEIIREIIKRFNERQNEGNGILLLLQEMLQKISAITALIEEKCFGLSEGGRPIRKVIEIGVMKRRLVVLEAINLAMLLIKRHIAIFVDENLASKIRLFRWWRHFRFLERRDFQK